MTRSVTNRPALENDTAAGRLREFLKSHPDAPWRFALVEIAQEIGVSRQMVFLLLPGWTREMHRLRASRVRAFARKHPAARLSDRSTRIPWPEIALQVGLPVPTVKKIWGESGLPTGGRVDAEVIKRNRAESQRRHLAKVLRPETCVMCGAHFAWTMQHERTRRYFGRSVTCSKSCRQRFHWARSNKH